VGIDLVRADLKIISGFGLREQNVGKQSRPVLSQTKQQRYAKKAIRSKPLL